MAEKPIIFSSEMVQAILDGRKTVTRRVMKPQPLLDLINKITRWENQPRGWFAFQGDKEIWPMRNWGLPEPKVKELYRVGDILWGKETYCNGIEWDDCRPGEVDPLCGGNDIWYLADGQRPSEGWGKTRSARFMPKWAVRIWLKVLDVRPEELQKITKEDAIKEGWPRHKEVFPTINTGDKAKLWFMKTWDYLNAKRGYPWESNPWVWRIEFERTKNNG